MHKRLETWAVGLSALVTVTWLAVIAPVAQRCLSQAQACASPNELGDFVAGATAPLAFVWLLCTVMLQVSQIGAQQRELSRMADKMIETDAAATFDAAVDAFAGRLVANDRAWFTEWKGQRIEFDRSAYEAEDSRLTIMKAEAELRRQLQAYEPDTPGGHKWFIMRDPDAFLEIRAALQRCIALSKQAPASYGPMIEEMNLPRFLESVEAMTAGSHNFLTEAKYGDMNLPVRRA